jgi:hypothetical protein
MIRNEIPVVFSWAKQSRRNSNETVSSFFVKNISTAIGNPTWKLSAHTVQMLPRVLSLDLRRIWPAFYSIGRRGIRAEFEAEIFFLPPLAKRKVHWVQSQTETVYIRSMLKVHFLFTLSSTFKQRWAWTLTSRSNARPRSNTQPSIERSERSYFFESRRQRSCPLPRSLLIV